MEVAIEELNFIDAFMFAFHLMYFAVKLWFLDVVLSMMIFSDTPKEGSKMIIFKKYEVYLFLWTIITLTYQGYFLYSYFNPYDLYYYEAIMVADQIIICGLLALYIKKGGHTDGE